MLLELLRADCDVAEEADAAGAAGAGVEHGVSARFGRVRRVVRRTSDFSVVSAREIELPQRALLAGALPAAHYAVVFDANNLAAADVFVQTAVLALPFRAAEPAPLPPLPPLHGVQRPPPQQPSATEQRLAALFSASAKLAAAGFAAAFLDVDAAPAVHGDEALLASPSARAYVAAQRGRHAQPHALAEAVWPSVMARAAARRARACDEAAGILLALERGILDADEAGARLRASLAEAATPPLDAVAADASQTAHAAFLAPLVRSYVRCTALSKRVLAEGGGSGGDAETAPALLPLLSACPRAYDCAGAALVDAAPADVAAAAAGAAAEALPDAFGARLGVDASPFAVRAAAALADHAAVARALANEAECVASAVAAAWGVAQRDATRHACAMARPAAA